MITKMSLRIQIVWHAINAWLVGLQDHRIPQILVLICGLTNAGLGFLFLWFPDRIDQTPALRYLSTTLSTDWWVVIFGATGIVQATVAVVKYTAGIVPCLLSFAAMMTFGIFTAVNFAMGPAAGIVTLLSLAIAAVNLLATAGAVAPSAAAESAEYLGRRGHDVDIDHADRVDHGA